MRKIITLGIMLLFLGMTISSSTGLYLEKQTIKPICMGNILYVGGSGPGNYTKIQDAIDNASSGDTVYVYAYSSPYYENVVVDKSINLIGEDRDTTVIDGNGVGDVVFVSANGTRISGFTLQNSGSGTYYNAGIVIHSSYNIVNDNFISDNNEFGIYCPMDYDYGENIIYDNIIENNKDYGILIEDTFYYENNVYSNHIENNTIGIFIRPSILPSAITYKNNIFGNTIIRNNVGVVISHGYGNLVFENNITNNERGISMGGDWGSGFNNSVYKNNIIDNEEGIILWSGWMGGGCNNNIYLNNIISNKKGIYITSYFEEGFPRYNNISQNNFIKNYRNALFYCSSIRWYGKNIWNNNYWGEPREKPRPIFGRICVIRFGLGLFPWINFDWHPEKEPYDIGV